MEATLHQQFVEPGIHAENRARSGARITDPAVWLEHDPEKWMSVFRKGHAQTKR
jgi:hypothetical protein